MTDDYEVDGVMAWLGWRAWLYDGHGDAGDAWIGSWIYNITWSITDSVYRSLI